MGAPPLRPPCPEGGAHVGCPLRFGVLETVADVGVEEGPEGRVGHRGHESRPCDALRRVGC